MCAGSNARRAFNRSSFSSHFPRLTLPILRLKGVVVGSMLPPKGVVGQTIVQVQRKITMVEFQKAEEFREQAENQRGIADRAYRESLRLTAPKFVALCRIEVRKEAVQHSPSAITVIMASCESPPRRALVSLSQGWSLSEPFPHVLDRDLAPCAGREVFQFEWTVLNAPEPGHFMPQCLEQSSDFTVFPLGQDHF